MQIVTARDCSNACMEQMERIFGRSWRDIVRFILGYTKFQRCHPYSLQRRSVKDWCLTDLRRVEVLSTPCWGLSLQVWVPVMLWSGEFVCVCVPVGVCVLLRVCSYMWVVQLHSQWVSIPQLACTMHETSITPAHEQPHKPELFQHPSCERRITHPLRGRKKKRKEKMNAYEWRACQREQGQRPKRQFRGWLRPKEASSVRTLHRIWMDN